MKILAKLAGKRRGADDFIFDSLNIIFMLLLCVVMLYPMVNTLAVSLNDATDTVRGGIYFWPREFTWYNFEHVFSQSQLLHAGMISVLRTVIGTAISVFCTAMVAYTISRKQFVLKKFVTIAFVLTMYLNGGLIPTYLLMRELSLIGTFWIYIIPGLIGVFNLIVIRSFIEGLPETIFESAKIDGAGEFTQFFKIALPLCLPVIATVSLFVAVGQWNSWFDVFIYNSNKPELSTLQYELMKILQNSNASMSSGSAASAFASSQSGVVETVTPQSVRAAMTIIVSVPIICVYPFLQKYFVKGLTLGGVKG
ncbi:carbohydrate ABC transporter permease [Halalkalibacterium halodurans]|jgi:putative aldouronate transport system permease protein|uniref:ABC transporter (Permease) n=2 Tax=Halalkalibacterium halodurans TaxID=86665 RepID=Q9KB22_HALH5|nr:carbohydrate ABC transporter permease [Halalkalibacterium halodurans]MDY7222662.1 carbohydrate ABC transporter permease [Halalkalibacterium halodurans]MDY7241883.1 carbohydrate ABC transporter permease [Halalkalibacterium halodurans]MED4082485.1 carbohydrate ABC transporter permease [Halalkalibacterium halodurans]MED4085010.1 carbohydrate ABC transporter permease [Halalkalibacterium halodurans]MED4107124.1 carbohydrate ABC transporter permease [Halalkalibacterium halodurans]